MTNFHLATPHEFSFDRALEFLERSPRELLHQVVKGSVYKAVTLSNGPVAFELAPSDEGLNVTVLSRKLKAPEQEELSLYVREWFDLDTDLKPFYAMARKDQLLKPLVKKYFGYRIVGQPDLYESLVWAVLGQQINLAFAYTLKQRFVESFGQRLECEGRSFDLFPTPAVGAKLTDAELLPLQFSRQKSKYTALISEAFASGQVSKEKLAGLPLVAAKEELMKIKGVGNWTANYALMKTFRYPDAFPLEDAGIHNALKNQLGLSAKPSLERVKKIFKAYRGWEAYATLYLWKSL